MAPPKPKLLPPPANVPFTNELTVDVKKPFAGFAGSLLSMLGGTGYFVYKLMFWHEFTLGIAPIVVVR